MKGEFADYERPKIWRNVTVGMVRVHGLLAFGSGLTLGISGFLTAYFSSDVSLLFLIPFLCMILAIFMILFVRKGHNSTFDVSGPESALAFYNSASVGVRRVIVASIVLASLAVFSAAILIAVKNGDSNISIFTNQLLFAVIAYILIGVATVFDLAEAQDSSYGTA